VQISPATYRALTPLICVALSLFVCWQQQALPTAITQILPQLPFILLSIACLIAALSNQSRELATSLVMLCAYWLIRNYLQTPLQSLPAAQIFYLLSYFVPSVILYLLFIPENGLRHAQGTGLAVLPATILFVLSQIFAAQPQLMAELGLRNIHDRLWDIHLSPLSGCWYLLVLICAITMTNRRGLIFDSSAAGCLLMLFITLGWIDINNISAVMFTGIGILLTVNITSGLFHMGFYDELTQIGNRRALLAALKTAGNKYSLAMVDADHFKKINDRFGHDLGDQALRVIANCISKTGGARAFRYGGEEFCLLFKGKSREEVADSLEQVRQTIANYDMAIRDKKHRPKDQASGLKRRGASKRHSNLRLTVSVGVVDSTDGGSFEQLIKLADRALYKAKASGRNQLAFA
jgi:diguanylate cyclase (GGDEF)-like protein